MTGCRQLDQMHTIFMYLISRQFVVLFVQVCASSMQKWFEFVFFSILCNIQEIHIQVDQLHYVNRLAPLRSKLFRIIACGKNCHIDSSSFFYRIVHETRVDYSR